MAHNDLFWDVRAAELLASAAFLPSVEREPIARGQVTQHVLDSGVLLTTYGDVSEYRMAAPVEAAVDLRTLDTRRFTPFVDADPSDAFEAAANELGFEGEWDEPFADECFTDECEYCGDFHFTSREWQR